MNSRSQQLAQRRAQLVQRIHAEREFLRQQASAIQQDLRWADYAWRLLGAARETPWLSAVAASAGAALLIKIKPRRLLWLAKKAYAGWRLIQRATPILRQLLQTPSTNAGEHQH